MFNLYSETNNTFALSSFITFIFTSFSSFGIKYTANTGTNKELFTLSKGENTLIIEGTGTVYFEWEEEVI